MAFKQSTETMKHVTLPNSQMFAKSNRYSIQAGLKETQVVIS